MRSNESGSGGLTCAILAAGDSSRMGRSKVSLVVQGRMLLERALDAATGYPTVVVVGTLPEPARALLAARARDGDVRVVINDAPHLGMNRSLALAHAAVADHDHAIAVLLVDTPFVDAALLAQVVAARAGADVAHPRRGDVPGHPVIFGPRARALIDALPPGDTLRLLRDDPRLARVRIAIDDHKPFIDIDTPDDLAALG